METRTGRGAPDSFSAEPMGGFMWLWIMFAAVVVMLSILGRVHPG